MPMASFNSNNDTNNSSNSDNSRMSSYYNPNLSIKNPSDITTNDNKNISKVTNDLKNAILSVLLDHTNESYNKLEELSSLQLECITELQAIKAQLGSNLGPNEVAELVSHSTLKLDEIELLMDSSAMRLKVINEGNDTSRLYTINTNYYY